MAELESTIPSDGLLYPGVQLGWKVMCWSLESAEAEARAGGSLHQPPPSPKSTHRSVWKTHPWLHAPTPREAD